MHNILEIRSSCRLILVLALVGCSESAEHHFCLEAQFLRLASILFFLKFNLELALFLLFLLASLFLSLTLQTLLLNLLLLVLRQICLLNLLLLSCHWLELSQTTGLWSLDLFDLLSGRIDNDLHFCLFLRRLLSYFLWRFRLLDNSFVGHVLFLLRSSLSSLCCRWSCLLLRCSGLLVRLGLSILARLWFLTGLVNI